MGAAASSTGCNYLVRKYTFHSNHQTMRGTGQDSRKEIAALKNRNPADQLYGRSVLNDLELLHAPSQPGDGSTAVQRNRAEPSTNACGLFYCVRCHRTRSAGTVRRWILASSSDSNKIRVCSRMSALGISEERKKEENQSLCFSLTNQKPRRLLGRYLPSR